MRAVEHHHSDAILGAMRQVALAGGGPITYADTASILAAGRYLLRRPGLNDIDSLPAVDPNDFVAALKGEVDLAREAVKYLAIMRWSTARSITASLRGCWSMPARSMSRPTT